MRRHSQAFASASQTFGKATLVASLFQKMRRSLGYGHKPEGRSAAQIFSEIYQHNMWGGDAGTFYSGPGSDEEYGRAFANLVNAFVRERGVKSIVDLGCGDFRVGRLIARPQISYTGVDVVDALVKRNRQLFARPGVDFRRIDIATDRLPKGDLCILRQVLQHLSNAEIVRILRKLRKYRFVIVAEHHPAPSRLSCKNLDRETQFDTRVESDSGVFLDRPPFDFSRASVLATLPLPPLRDPGERLMVYLIERAKWKYLPWCL